MSAWRAAAALRSRFTRSARSPSRIHRFSVRSFSQQQQQVVCSEEEEDDASISALFRSVEKRPDAVHALNEWMSKGNVLSENTLSRLYSWMSRNKLYVQALKLCTAVRQENLAPLTIPHYVFEIDVLCRQRSCAKGEALYKSLPEEVRNDVRVKSNLILSFSKQQQGAVQRVEKWMEVFKDQVGVEAWNGALQMYMSRDKHPILESTYHRMINFNVNFTPETYHTLLRCRHRVGGFEGIEERALQCMQKTDTKTADVQQLTRMMECYGYLKRAEDVDKLWEEVKQRNPGEEAYVGAIRAFGLVGDASKVKDVFKELKREKEKVPVSAYTAMIKVYSHLGMMDKAEMLLKKHFSKSSSSGSSSSSSNEENDQPPDFLPYDHIVSGYLANDEPQSALQKYKEGVRETSKLQYRTVMGLLEVFRKKRDVDGAEEVMLHYPVYFGDTSLYNQLLKVYVAAIKLPKDFRKRMQGQFAEPNQETEELLRKIAEAHGRKAL